MSRRNARPRTFKKSWRPKSQQRSRALSAGGDRFVDSSGNAFHGEVSVNEDRSGTGEWRVEYFDDDGGCAGSAAMNEGVQFEILADGKPHSYGALKDVAIASAELIKSHNPLSEVAVRDTKTGEVTPVSYTPGII